MKFKAFAFDRQLDVMDCGAACLKMIAKHYGKYYSLQLLRDKCGTSKDGVSFLDLSHAAESIGLHSVAVKCSLSELIDKIPLPCIIHWTNNHFVVLYSVRRRRRIGVKTPDGVSSGRSGKGINHIRSKRFRRGMARQFGKGGRIATST